MSTSARSFTADNAVGHDAHAASFTRLAKEGALGHAYLLYGDEGIGKFRFAAALAAFLERGIWDAKRFETLTDTLVLTRGSEATSLGIEAVRAMRRFLSQTPLRSPRRTVILRDAEDLTREAESALLKTVEEPPSHALILCVAKDPSVLFPPLASRMAKIYFARLSHEALTVFLVEQHTMSRSEASVLAARSFGRPGRAIRLMEEGKRKKSKEPDTLSARLEALILARWERLHSLRESPEPQGSRGVAKEAGALAFLLSRAEAAARFNLNPGLQEKAVAYMLRK